MNRNKQFLVYRASAGSGKTYAIALQYIAQLMRGTSHKHILAVTFTKDATGEMKERILEKLYDLSQMTDEGFMKSLLAELPAMTKEDISAKAAEALKNILHDYSRFHVTTIDSFFQQVVRNLARELGTGSQFNIEIDTEMPVHEAVRSMLQEATHNEATLSRITAFVEHKLEDGRWSIEKDLQSFGQNIFKESFQDKEKRLREQLNDNPAKIKETIAECKKIRKIFENTMAQYAGRFSDSGMEFYQGTVKGVPGYFRKLLKKDWSEPNSYVKAVLAGEKGKGGDLHYLQLLRDTEEYRNRNIRQYNAACLLLKYIYQLELIEDLSDKINEHNAEQNRFMLAKTSQLLSEMVGERDASFVYEKIGAEIKHVVIDEFQDTSTLQWRNFRVLISEILSSNRFGMLVGDVKQSIYRWRNGNWRILNNIEESLGGLADYRTLDVNYRSDRIVVEFNNRLFKQAAAGLSNPLQKAYAAVEQKSVDKSGSGYVSVDFTDKDDSRDYNEAVIDLVAEKIRRLLDSGVSVPDICILCRTNQQIRDMAAALPARLEGIKIISEEAYQLGASGDLQIITAALRYVSDPSDSVSGYILREKLSGVSSYKGAADVDIHFPTRLPLYELILEIVRRFNLQESAFLYAFMDRTADYLSRNTADIRAFLDYWDTKLSGESVPLPTGKDSSRDGILAMSIHKSKGLQFHTVIVPFADWDIAPKSSFYRQNLLWCSGEQPPFDLSLLPIEYNDQMNNSLFSHAFADETEMLEMDSLNVLYVALTRAEHNLVIISKTPSLKTETLRIQNILKNILGGNIEQGEIVKSAVKKDEQTANVFKSTGAVQEEITFKPVKTEVRYMQTTRAQRFVKGDDDLNDRNEYVREGNIIHNLFSYIQTADDTSRAVETLIERGVINSSDREKYAARLKGYISQKKEWFSGRYKIINECSILTAEGTYRCDRVMLNDMDNAIVVDYKTGAEHASHRKQTLKYMQLLQQMGFPQTQGFIWYLNDNNIIEIK